MKRSELYAWVWAKPVIRLAKELGVSDVGLAKACRRQNIPIPPRGHWTKLQFGKSSPQTALPPQDQDNEVQLTIPTPREIARKEKNRALVNAVERVAERLPPPQFEISTELVKQHPLVKATNTYLKRLPKVIKRYQRTNWLDRGEDFESPPYEQHGRYSFKVPSGLVVTASLEKMDWVLRFYNSLFAALAQAGARAKRTDADQPRSPKEARVCLELTGESLTLTMSEGYRKHELDAEEFRLAKLKSSWAQAWRYVPSEKFTLHVRGTEYSVSKEWRGTTAQFEPQFPNIVATILTLLRGQSAVREDRIREEEVRRAAAQKADAVRQVNEAKAEQLKRAFSIAMEHDRVTQLNKFLDTLETELSSFMEPYQERARVWIAVVREELARRDPYLVALQSSLSPEYSWSTWPPRWWPLPTNESDDK
jgi:hypothetical protein